MKLAHISLLVQDYDEAIQFFTRKLPFEVFEDTYVPDQDKRWVIIGIPNSEGPTLVLAKASTESQLAAIGNQTGGRVFLFLHTNNFESDYQSMVANGIEFVRLPAKESFGTVAVFKDLYGNLWDLVEPSS